LGGEKITKEQNGGKNYRSYRFEIAEEAKEGKTKRKRMCALRKRGYLIIVVRIRW